MNKLKIISVNISEKKGVIKSPVSSIELYEEGIRNDAHAGKWHRQVSILSAESIRKFSLKLGRNIESGEFAENITLEGFDVAGSKVFDRIKCGGVILEVTQIGKKCHGSNCTVFKESGDCIMPKEGVFCRVIKGGVLSPGDVAEYRPKIISVNVITLSDRAAAGIYKDKSGPYLENLVMDFFDNNGRKVNVTRSLISDDPEQLKELILDNILNETDIVFTTGGTGISRRDITPDVVKQLLDKEIPGIMEFVRVKYGTQNPNALLSRSIAGVAGKTLIYVLPGSPGSLKEYTDEIFKTLEHSFRMLHNIDSH